MSVNRYAASLAVKLWAEARHRSGSESCSSVEDSCLSQVLYPTVPTLPPSALSPYPPLLFILFDFPSSPYLTFPHPLLFTLLGLLPLPPGTSHPIIVTLPPKVFSFMPSLTWPQGWRCQWNWHKRWPCLTTVYKDPSMKSTRHTENPFLFEYLSNGLSDFSDFIIIYHNLSAFHSFPFYVHQH